MINIVFFVVFAALCAASLYVWRQAAQGYETGLPFQWQRVPYASPLGLVDVGVMFVTWIAGQLLGTMCLYQAGMSLENAVQSKNLAIMIGIMAICQLASTGLGLAILYLRYQSLESLGLLWSNWRSEIKLGLIAFILVVPPLLILQWMLTFFVEYSHASMDALKDDPTLLTIAAVWLGAVISAPICEEIFFRGILQAWLQRWTGRKTSLEKTIAGGWYSRTTEPISEFPLQSWQNTTTREVAFQQPTTRLDSGSIEIDNPYQSPKPFDLKPEQSRIDLEANADGKLAIFISSLVFAAVHVGQGLAPIPLFMMGIAFGYLYYKTNSLLPCIVLHMGLNAFSMFWFTVSLFN